MSETIKISQLNAVEEVNNNDIIPIVQDGRTKKVTIEKLLIKERKKLELLKQNLINVETNIANTINIADSSGLPAVVNIYGSSVQSAVPSSTTPVEIQNVDKDINIIISNGDNSKRQNYLFPINPNQKMAEKDYIDKNGIHHLRKQKILDGTEEWILEMQKENYATFQLSLKGAMVNIGNRTELDVLANYFPAKKVYSTEEEGILHIWDSIYISFTTKTVQEFKAFLANKKAEGKPVVIEYNLLAEETEKFSEAQQKAYNTLQNTETYKLETNINTEQAKLKVKYVADTKTYIDNRISALSNAMLN